MGQGLKQRQGYTLDTKEFSIKYFSSKTKQTIGPRWPCITHLITRQVVYWPFGSPEEVQYRFSRWQPWRLSWILIFLAVFDLQITSILLIKFRVNLPFCQEENQNSFPTWLQWQSSWISDWNDFSYLLSTSFYKTWYFISSFESVGLLVKEKNFETEPWYPSLISNQNDFTNFRSASHSDRCFLPSFQSIGILVQEKKFKIEFQHSRYGNHLGFLIGMSLAILFYLQVTGKGTRASYNAAKCIARHAVHHARQEDDKRSTRILTPSLQKSTALLASLEERTLMFLVANWWRMKQGRCQWVETQSRRPG